MADNALTRLSLGGQLAAAAANKPIPGSTASQAAAPKR